MCFVESLLVPAIFLLARAATGSQKMTLAASAVAVFFPTWIVPSGAILTDILGAVLLSLTVWSLLQGHKRQSLLWFISAGVAWGMLTMVRAQAPIYGPAIIVWLLLNLPGWKRCFLAVVVTNFIV